MMIVSGDEDDRCLMSVSCKAAITRRAGMGRMEEFSPRVTIVAIIITNVSLYNY